MDTVSLFMPSISPERVVTISTCLTETASFRLISLLLSASFISALRENQWNGRIWEASKKG